MTHLFAHEIGLVEVLIPALYVVTHWEVVLVVLHAVQKHGFLQRPVSHVEVTKSRIFKATTHCRCHSIEISDVVVYVHHKSCIWSCIQRGIMFDEKSVYTHRRVDTNWCKSWFNTTRPSYQYRRLHCGDKTVTISFHLHIGITYTGRTIYQCWKGTLYLWARLVNITLSQNRRRTTARPKWGPVLLKPCVS